MINDAIVEFLTTERNRTISAGSAADIYSITTSLVISYQSVKCNTINSDNLRIIRVQNDTQPKNI